MDLLKWFKKRDEKAQNPIQPTSVETVNKEPRKLQETVLQETWRESDEVFKKISEYLSTDKEEGGPRYAAIKELLAQHPQFNINYMPSNAQGNLLSEYMRGRYWSEELNEVVDFLLNMGVSADGSGIDTQGNLVKTHMSNNPLVIATHDQWVHPNHEVIKKLIDHGAVTDELKKNPEPEVLDHLLGCFEVDSVNDLLKAGIRPTNEQLNMFVQTLSYGQRDDCTAQRRKDCTDEKAQEIIQNLVRMGAHIDTSSAQWNNVAGIDKNPQYLEMCKNAQRQYERAALDNNLGYRR